MRSVLLSFANFIICVLFLFLSSHAAAFIAVTALGFTDVGIEYFTKPHIGWGTRSPWYEASSGIALMGQLFALPGLIIYLFITFNLLRKKIDDFDSYVIPAAIISGINGLIFFPLFFGMITMLFICAGIITGIIFYTLIFKVLFKLFSFNF